MKTQMGAYRLGVSTFRLFISDEMAGASFNVYDQAANFDMTIGIALGWDEVCKNLFHELTEAAFTINGCCYFKEPSFSQDNGHFKIVADHTQFSEAMAQAADTYEMVRKPLKKAYKTYMKELEDE